MIAYTLTYGILSLASIPCLGRIVNGTWKFWTIKKED